MRTVGFYYDGSECFELQVTGLYRNGMKGRRMEKWIRRKELDVKSEAY